MTGTCEYLTGRFAESTQILREAEAEWLARPGGTWELNSLRILLLLSLRRTGMFNELSRLYDAYRRDAIRRGDRLAETTISRALNQMWLVRDRPEHAREELARSSWTSETGFMHLQNWYEIESHVDIDLYTGEITDTRARFGDALAKVGGSLLVRSPNRAHVVLVSRRPTRACRAARRTGRCGPSEVRAQAREGGRAVRDDLGAPPARR